MPHPGVVEPGDQLHGEPAVGAHVEDRAHGGDLIPVEARGDAHTAGAAGHGIVELLAPGRVARIDRREHAEERVIGTRGEHGLVAGARVEAEQGRQV
ncbi:hypothetical protein D3C73_1469650 [compost metagenome]